MREPFAARVAALAATGAADEGLVIGIAAPWGDGKTSLLALVKGALSQQYGEQVKVVEFNPWFWSGTSQLARQFFELIADRLSPAAHWPPRLGELLRRYGGLLAPLMSMHTSEGMAAGGVGVIMYTIGKALRSTKRTHPSELDAWRSEIKDLLRSGPRRGPPARSRSVVRLRDSRGRAACSTDGRISEH